MPSSTLCTLLHPCSFPVVNQGQPHPAPSRNSFLSAFLASSRDSSFRTECKPETSRTCLLYRHTPQSPAWTEGHTEAKTTLFDISLGQKAHPNDGRGSGSPEEQLPGVGQSRLRCWLRCLCADLILTLLLSHKP